MANKKWMILIALLLAFACVLCSCTNGKNNDENKEEETTAGNEKICHKHLYLKSWECALCHHKINTSFGIAHEASLDPSVRCAIVKGMGICTDSDIVIEHTYSGYPVIGIGNGAFYRCKNIRSVMIPDTVVTIGDRAFENCFGMEAITIPDSVVAIGESAFSSCHNLTTITIFEGTGTSNGMLFIGKNAFSNCSNLSTVYYSGTPTTWENIQISEGNSDFENANRYFYSETQPTNVLYKCWHYVNGVPTPW